MLHDSDLSYRRPMPVREIVYHQETRTAYPRCPRCGDAIDREYMRYCSQCGQCLDWRGVRKAVVRVIP